ncbi:MAG: hydroxymethylbilane synthase, partial [Candidatus Rokubacteria bacterium]|nr:hydroxymethylbilane synthase [Candidatus Rokubacteria bacterium]
MIRLGTRASALAVAQATAVAEWLRRRGTEVELVPMRTEGDRLLDARLGDRGGKGLFVREIEEALGDGRIDLAVHSLKDLPAEQPAGLELAVFPEREDARDVLVTREGGGLGGLRPGAMVGTSSLRRRAVLLSLRDDLAIEPIRGNVETRLRKLLDGRCDAVIVAAAGLRRLGLRPDHAEALAPEV